MRTGGRTVVAAAAMAVVVASSGCSGSQESATAIPSGSSTAVGSSAAADVVVAAQVPGFSDRTVRFANIDYTVTGATVTNQDLRSYAEGTEAVVDGGGRTFLVLDVKAENTLGSTQVGLEDEAVGLMVADERVGLESGFLTDVTGYLRGGTSVTSFLAFEVDAEADAADLADAVLVFGAQPDRPALVPLTGPVPESGYPVTTELTGKATGTGPTNGGTISFKVRDAMVAIDLPHEQVTSPTGQRADESTVFVQVHVRATKTRGRGDDLLADAFRLRVDGDPIAPFDVAQTASGSTGTPMATPGATVDAWVLFLVPTDASTLVLQVGAFDDEPGTIPLEVDLEP